VGDSTFAEPEIRMGRALDAHACNGGGEHRIAILDDIFPHIGSAFRFEEFRTYLDKLPNVEIHSSGGAFSFAQETRPVEALIAAHVAEHPAHASRIHPLDPGRFPDAGLYYAVFLHIIFGCIEQIEARQKPFAFTLYPGGSFAIDDAGSDSRLQRVFQSPCFRTVIVTQTLTRRYLLEKRLCREDQIIFLHNGVLTRGAVLPPLAKTRFGFGKATLDLAFVANRYSALGTEKGYDLFVAMAQALIRRSIPARFHVVGPFDASVIDLAEEAPHFRFYGSQPTAFFHAFYAGIDAIVSPNRPFVLGPGKFDGFPNGCCCEAGLQETAMICTDELGLNVDYQDGVDVVLIRPDCDDIVAKILALIEAPAHLTALGINARRRMLDLYSFERQMAPRIALLERLLAEG
jgi:glycosyltransferase involved in cell wall biosynthesis